MWFSSAVLLLQLLLLVLCQCHCCMYSCSLFPDNEQPHPVTSCLLLSSIISSYLVPEKNNQPGQRRRPHLLHQASAFVSVRSTCVSDGRVVQQCIYWSLCAGCRLKDHAGLRAWSPLVFPVIADICVYLCEFYRLFQNEFFFVFFVIWIITAVHLWVSAE